MGNAARKDRKRIVRRQLELGSLDMARDHQFQHPVKVKTHMHPTQARDFAKARDRIGQQQMAQYLTDIQSPIKPVNPLLETDWEAHKERNKPLDPKPYRIGRKRYSFEDTSELEGEVIFSPRKNYQQDELLYP